MKKRFYLFSYGLTLPFHITLETMMALRKCDIIYSNCLDSDSLKTTLKFDLKIISLKDTSYKKIAPVIHKAVRKHDTVGFLTYGNPLFLCPPWNELTVSLSETAEVTVFPGVSSFDMFINTFNAAPFPSKGMLLIDASSYDGGALDPGKDNIIFSPFKYNSVTELKNRPDLKKALKSYPPLTPVYLVQFRHEGNRHITRVIKGCISCVGSIIGAAEKVFCSLKSRR